MVTAEEAGVRPLGHVGDGEKPFQWAQGSWQ